jgi:hypothetical protein
MPSYSGQSINVSPHFGILGQALPTAEQPIQDPDSSQDHETSVDNSMGPEIGAVSPIKEARAALLQEKLSAQALKADSEVSKFATV